MLVGYRDEFIKRLRAQGLTEQNLCDAVNERFSNAWNESLRWRSYWQSVLEFFFPALNNISFTNSGGEVAFARVYASDPANFIMEILDFYMEKLFPRGDVWYRAMPFSPKGQMVERHDVSLAEQRFMDDISYLSRDLVLKSGFYKSVRTTAMHYLTLGECYNFIRTSKQKMVCEDLPVHKIGVLKDSAGTVEGLGFYLALQDWEIKREFGDGAVLLFEQSENRVSRQSSPGIGGNYSSSGYSMGTVGVSTSAAGFPGSQQNTNRKIKHCMKIVVPNEAYAGIPGAGILMKEMPYMGLYLTTDTKRLVDVEYYPKAPFGSASDVRVAGEYFARGLGGRMLPDVAVMNSKKKTELESDSLTMQPPIVLKGRGFVNNVGLPLKPRQLLHVAPDTEVEPLFDNNGMYRRNRSAVEDERLSLGEAVRRDRMIPDLKSHTTLGAYTQEKDGQLGFLAPTGLELHYNVGLPIVEAIINSGIMMGLLPPPPPEMLESPFSYQLVPISIFTFGQESEKAQNLTRVLRPLEPFIQAKPQLLDTFNSAKFLKNGLSRMELSEYVNSDEQAREAMRERLEAMGGQGQGQDRNPANEALDNRVRETLEGGLTGGDVEGYAGVL